MIGDFTHVCNRGVEKRKIFVDQADYKRFKDNLFLLNNVSGKIRTRRNILSDCAVTNGQDKLVEILKWCLMPNHYHLLLYEVKEGGTLEFIKRLGNAYTKYFNIKNSGRSGYLFQNSAKILRLENDSHFLYIPFYIDLNPVKLGRDRDIIDFLTGYPWSSYKDYYGQGNDSFIINKDLFYEQFDTTPKRYQDEMLDLWSERQSIEEIERVDLAG